MANENPQGRGALDAFLNLLSLITLGWLAISIGGILFQMIDKFFNPDIAGTFSQFNQTGLKFYVASSIIIAPIFLLVSGFLHRNYKEGRLSHDSGIYRWLTYLMLLISSLNIIGSLIAIIYRLLEGNYTTASLLKILVVFLIALGIFGYYWYDLRRKDYKVRSNISVIAVAVVSIITLAVVVGSFFVIDPPKVSRMKAYDQTRANDLSQVSNLILQEYMMNKKLPADLSEAKYLTITDPETRKPYEYNLIEAEKYELCATFSLPADKNDTRYLGAGDWYYHQAGNQCFTVNVANTLLKTPTAVPAQ